MLTESRPARVAFYFFYTIATKNSSPLAGLRLSVLPTKYRLVR